MHLDKAIKQMKKWVANKRRHVEFNVGDLVLVKILPSKYKYADLVHKGLVQRYKGPFFIITRVGNASYKLELPSWFKIHSVFHVSCLKPYHGDTKDLVRGESKCPPLSNTRVYNKEVKTILPDHIVRKKSFLSY